MVNVLKGGMTFNFGETLRSGPSCLNALPGCLEPISIGKDAPGFSQRVLGRLPAGILKEVSRVGGGSGYEPTDVVEGSLVVDANVCNLRVSEGSNNRRNFGSSGGASLPRDGVPLFDAFGDGLGLKYGAVGAGRGELAGVIIIAQGMGVVTGGRVGPPDTYSGDGRPRDGWKVHPSVRETIGKRWRFTMWSNFMEVEVGGLGKGPFELFKCLPGIECVAVGDGV